MSRAVIGEAERGVLGGFVKQTVYWDRKDFVVFFLNHCPHSRPPRFFEELVFRLLHWNILNMQRETGSKLLMPYKSVGLVAEDVPFCVNQLGMG